MLAFATTMGIMAMAGTPTSGIGPDDFIRVAQDGWSFEVAATGERYIPFGCNLVFNHPGPLNQGLHVLVQEDWDPEAIQRAFRGAREANMNVLKVFLPSAQVLPDPQPTDGARIADMTPPLFERLDFLFATARETGVYVSLTLAEWGMHSLDWWHEGGTFLGRPDAGPDAPCAHRVLHGFWRQIARRYRNEPALLSYNLAVEFYMPGGNWGAGQGPDHDYLLNDRWGLPAWHAWIAQVHGDVGAMNAAWGTDYPAIDAAPQPRIDFEGDAYTMPQAMIADYISFKETVTYRFLKNEVDAIRMEDGRHMVTCGFHPHQPGANWMGSARYTAGIACTELDFLDYVTTHHYSNPEDHVAGQGVPERAYNHAVLNTRFMYAGKPVVVEEMGHVVNDPVETREGTIEFVRRLVGHASGFMLWFLSDLPEHEIYGPLDADLQLNDFGRAWRALAEPGGIVAELPRERTAARSTVKLDRTEGLAPVRLTWTQRLTEDPGLLDQPVDYDWPPNPNLPPRVWNDPAIAALLPRPRQVALEEGRFMPPGNAVVAFAAPADVSGERLRARIDETLRALGMEPEIMQASPNLSGFSLVLGSGKRLPPQPTVDADLPEEGYTLAVAPSLVTITSPSERGLFYGMMTFMQLVENARAAGLDDIPCVHVRDWPALAMRGPHEDFGRDQLPTMDDLKRSIRTAAKYKMNTYMWFIEPDHFVYAFDPEISTDYDRFTFDEIRELVAYARDYYVEVVPVVELLAHMEMTLRHERYHPLSETGHGGTAICPTCDDSFELIRNMVNEIAPAFGATYFHCGLDESQEVGSGRSKDAIAERGIEQVYADYYVRMNDLVKSHGQTMVMYADIVLNHPGILDLLPRDIVMMFWDYIPKDRYEGFDKLAEMGFPVMALSGLWDWCNLYPVYPPGFDNMAVLAEQAAELGAIGHFVSSWGDGYRGAAGTNLSELNQFGFVYCGAVSWNPRPFPLDAYAEAFARSYFGATTPHTADALRRLARAQGDDLRRNTQARRVLYDDLMQTAAMMYGADEATVAYWRRLKREATAGERLLAEAKVTRNEDYLRVAGLAARMLACAADMALVGQTIAAGDTEAALRDVAELEQRHTALWEEYAAAWRATNRPINLEHIGKSWRAATADIARFAETLAAGKFPPDFEEGERMAFTFDGADAAAWTASGKPEVTLRSAAAGTPELLPGGPSEEGAFLRLPHGAHLEATDAERALDFLTAPFYVQGWVRHGGQREQQYGASIFSCGTDGGFRFGLNHRGELLFTLYGIGEAAGTQSIVPADGAWHHVAADFRDGSLVTMYVDGQRTEQIALRGFPRNPTNPLIRIGNEIALVTPFEGDLDRIRVGCGLLSDETLDARP